MIIRFITVLMLAIVVQGCQAETESAAVLSNDAQQNAVEKAIMDFSTALTNKDLALLLTIADPKEVSVVRLFTSGNLGGRGAPLSQAFASSKINSELAFDIKNQTAFDIPGLFVNLPIKTFSDLPQRTLVSEADTKYFDQWEGVLKQSLKDAPESIEGDSVILGSSKYHVYAEAQIITDILVGGFAVFEIKNGKPKLVALIELL